MDAPAVLNYHDVGRSVSKRIEAVGFEVGEFSLKRVVLMGDDLENYEKGDEIVAVVVYSGTLEPAAVEGILNDEVLTKPDEDIKLQIRAARARLETGDKQLYDVTTDEWMQKGYGGVGHTVIRWRKDRVAFPKHHHVKNVVPEDSVSDFWNPVNYSGWSSKKLSDYLSDKVFVPSYGFRVENFSINELEQLHYLHNVFALSHFPIKKLSRFLRSIRWDVKSHDHHMTAEFKFKQGRMDLFNVVEWPDIYRRFDPRVMDTAFSETIFHELGHAVSAYLRHTGRLKPAELDAWSVLCGFKKYTYKIVKVKSPKSLVTAYAKSSPEEALAEYFSAYLTHKKLVDDYLDGKNASSTIHLYADGTLRDITNDKGMFLWIREHFFNTLKKD